MKSILVIIITLISFISLKSQSLPDDIDISNSSNGIVALPANVPATFAANGFVKYTKIQCPNGEAIHFIAQNLISDAQIIYSRTLLEFYLTNFAGSQYGTDKAAVMNSMGTNNAMLMIVNGTHVEGQEPNINAQGLYQNEISVPGHTWYQTNDYDSHRDAAFEEILHLMHDKGIGVDGINSTPGALPAYQSDIRAAQNNAILNNYEIWPKGAANDLTWYNDLAQENSLSQEYLASVIDCYYGLWGAWLDDLNTGMWGEYISHTRAEIQTEDPMGWALVPKYFSPFISVDMIIDPTFNGIFSITFNAANQYTHKSRYLQHCYLSGTNSSGLKGNDLYNRLKGNEANNSFEGLKGNDRLDGSVGMDTAIFTGNASEYNVNNLSSYAIVTDQIANRDGIDTLWNMEYLKYTDQLTEITLTPTKISERTISNLLVNIFPNPSSNNLSIALTEVTRNVDIKIVDVTGRIVSSRKYGLVEKIELDISHLQVGTYYLITSTERNIGTSKFIKKQ